MKIGIISRSNIFNGSARVRVLQFIPYWESEGCQVAVLQRESKTDIFSRLFFIKNIFILAITSDVLFLQKPNLSNSIITFINFINKNIVVDFDDAVWSQPPGKIDGKFSKVNEIFGNRLLFAIKKSKAVIAGSNYLADWVKKSVPNATIYIVPPSVEFQKKQKKIKKSINESDKIVVGWIGSEGNMIDFQHLNTVFEKLYKKKSNNFLIISSKPNILLPDFYQFDEWHLETEIESLSKIDIGIMPLIDDDRSRGRCGYKAIQYMALGIPVISSPVGSASEVVIDNVTGILASSSQDWEDAITRLTTNLELRKLLGDNGKKRVEKLYTTQINSVFLLDIFKKLI